MRRFEFAGASELANSTNAWLLRVQLHLSRPPPGSRSPVPTPHIR
jgi:hypothetical protein